MQLHGNDAGNALLLVYSCWRSSVVVVVAVVVVVVVAGILVVGY